MEAMGEANSTMGRDSEDGGLRREPELNPPDSAEPVQPSLDEFAFDDGPDAASVDVEAQRIRRLDRQVRSLARQAALDPDDGLEL
jgi:type IV secretion system protein VirD4